MKKFFYNNLGIRAVTIYFCFALMGLINDYKIIYSRNVCMMFFTIIISMNTGYEMEFMFTVTF